MFDDPRDFLLDLLQRVRRVAALDDDTALEQLAELANELRTGFDWQRERAREVLSGFRSEAAHIQNEIQYNVRPERWWTGRDPLHRLREFDLRWPDELRTQFAGDVAEVRHNVEPIARAAAVHGAVSLLNQALQEPIANTMVSERILRDASAAEDLLKEVGEAGAKAGLLRQVRERAARYRWQRKMHEAEVVEAGGNEKKAARLRAEASVVLRQDWVRAFPEESPPAA